jgi:hypothetical protein
MLFIVTATLTFDLMTRETNRVLPLPQGNHVAKIGQDPIYRTKDHAETTIFSKKIFIVTLTFDLMTPQ